MLRISALATELRRVKGVRVILVLILVVLLAAALAYWPSSVRSSRHAKKVAASMPAMLCVCIEGPPPFC